MQRYIFTMGLDTTNLIGVENHRYVFKKEVKPIFDKNMIECSFFKFVFGLEEFKRVAMYILYSDDELDFGIFDDLKKKFRIEIEPFKDIKKYNGFVFKHNKVDFEEFLQQEDAAGDWCIYIDEDENSFVSFDILRYDDTEVEGCIGNGFDYGIEIDLETVEKFAERYGFEIVE